MSTIPFIIPAPRPPPPPPPGPPPRRLPFFGLLPDSPPSSPRTPPAVLPPPMALTPVLSKQEQMDEGKLMDVFQIPEIDNNLLDIIDPALFTTQAERDSIELFIKTYSAYHIRNFTPAQKESLKQRLWHNQVLITLIKNLDKPKLYAVNYLEGPISFKLFQFNNKTVYLFGEIHKNTRDQCILDGKPPPPFSIKNDSPTDTIRLNQFIELLSYDTPSFFDFYIETGTEDFYKIISSNPKIEINTTSIFLYIFYLLYDNTKIYDEIYFDNYSHGFHIITEMNRIAQDFINRNNIFGPVSTGIIPDQKLLDDIYSYYMSNKNIYSHEISTADFEMYETKYKFSNCFHPDIRKNRIECKLGRFHNVDPRRILPSNILEPLQMIVTLFTTNVIKVEPSFSKGYGWFFLLQKSGFEAFLQKILDASTGTSDENMFNYILDMYPIVKKEWERSYYKQEIKDFFKNKIKNPFGGPSNLDTWANYFLYMFGDPNATTSNLVVYKPYMYDILWVFFTISTYIMDIYCLSRVFKKFKIKTDCQPEETYNIIIYAGNLHSILYSDFIISLGNIPIYQTNNPNYSCVELGFNSASNPIDNLNI